MNLLTKNELRQLIADGDTEQTLEALQSIAEYTGDNDLLTAVLLQHAQYSQYKKERTYNLTSDEELDRTLNRINFALFGIINDLSEPYQKAATPLATQKSKQGSILYHFPNPMQLGEESKCTIRIAFEEIILKAEWTDMEDTTIQSIRISDVMTVELLEPSTTPNFEIRSFSSQEQFIDKDDFTEWLFYVKPLRQGSFPLLLRVGIIEVINERERRREIVLEETIDIVAELPQVDIRPSYKTIEHTITLNTVESTPPPTPGASGGVEQENATPPAPKLDNVVLPPPPSPAPEPVPPAPKKRRSVLPWIAGATSVLLLLIFALPILFTSKSSITEEADDPFQVNKGSDPGRDSTAVPRFIFSVFLYETDGQQDTLRNLNGQLVLQLTESGEQSDPATIDATGFATWADLPWQLVGQTATLVLESEEYALAMDAPIFVLQDTIIGIPVITQ